MRVLVCCLLSCSFKSIGTLILIFAVTGTGALATALFWFPLSFLLGQLLDSGWHDLKWLQFCLFFA